MFANIDWFDFIVGGFFMGTLVNLLSNYLYPKLEAFASKYSNSLRDKIYFRSEKIKEDVERVLTNPHEEIVFRHIYSNRIARFAHSKNISFITSMIGLLILSLSTSLGQNIVGIGMVIMGFVNSFLAGYRDKDIRVLGKIASLIDEKKERPNYKNW